MNQTINVRIITPKRTLFEGKVMAVSSANSMGSFDILANHANFITLVENKPIVITQTDGKTTDFKFSLAIIHSFQDAVNIYTDIQDVFN